MVSFVELAYNLCKKGTRQAMRHHRYSSYRKLANRLVTSPSLIVNADDYGYFICVSRGIIDGAKHGVITATGIIANSYYFDQCIPWLRSTEGLDTGIHLTLTYGRPLTSHMATLLSRWHGAFPEKYHVALGIFTHQLPLRAVKEEWRTQIHRCLNAGLQVHFLNSHEHIHMLPPLFTLFLELAEECRIPYVRYPKPEWQGGVGIGGLVRNLILQTMHGANWRHVPKGTPVLLGLKTSGKLNLPYLQKCFATLCPGNVYELMCHPGYFDICEIQDPRLLSYHRWEDELRLLRSEAFRELCRSQGIQIIRYRDLPHTQSLTTHTE